MPLVLRQVRRNWVFSFVVCGLIGCGGGGGEPLGQVTGKVTFGGAPVTEGTVSFLASKSGRAGAGTISADGSYTLSGTNGGIPPGEYKIVVVPPEVEVPGDGTTAPVMAPKDMPNIPEKYRLEETTDLKASVKAGPNTVPVDLK